MKRFLKPAYLPPITLGAGALTFLLRLWLFAIGEDDQGLLPVGNFPDAMSWIITALNMALLFVVTRQMRKGNKYTTNFHASMHAAIGIALAALGFAVSSIVDLSRGADALGAFSAILGFVAAAAMLMLSHARMQGNRLSIIFHGIVCVFLMLHLVSHYRLWSSSPQVQTYGFELLAIVFVMLSCYQRAAFDAGKGNRQAYTFFSLAALFFCVATLPGCDNVAFFIGSAAWMYMTPCRLNLPVKKEN